ncbi:MAG: polysaccharide biosynthesis/export family protein [Candidatus Methylacidiphilales bacterium]|nr:polysaccharide biosynthesis/export family protein [Candidatus Methylacidiphilales bacterium]
MKHGILLLFLLLAMEPWIPAQDVPDAPATVPPPAESPLSQSPSPSPSSSSSPSWRDKYTLGPGDILLVHFYGKPTLTRENITVTPDGRITYLDAVNIPAAGLTIDELRVSLEQNLSRSFRQPKLVITPVALKSKSYAILGKVKRPGVYTLDRPMTLIEAIGRSEGIEIGLFEHRSIELADYARSYIIREGKRLPVSFEDIFLRGNLEQNPQLEPGDYIFVASSIANDYYVLGAVTSPGFQGFSNDATVITAIANRGGFTRTAFRERVLVVRGSLDKPQTFVLNVDDMLRGKAPAFRLEPKDIVFVNNRPWYKVEDLLDRALLTFMESAASTWTSANIPNIINRRLLPRTDWNNETP